MGIDNELGIDHGEQFELIHDRLYTLLMHYACLQHFFHCELSDFLSLKSVTADSPYLAETATANRIFIVEQILV